MSKDGAVAPRAGCILLQLISGNGREVSVERSELVTRRGGDWLAAVRTSYFCRKESSLTRKILTHLRTWSPYDLITFQWPFLSTPLL